MSEIDIANVRSRIRQARERLEEIALGDVLSRIRQAQERLGWSDRRLGKEAGFSEDFIRNLRRQFASGSQKSLRLYSLQQLARALGTTPLWLMTGQEEERPRSVPTKQARQATRRKPILGEVAPGRWVDEALSDANPCGLVVPVDPRYRADEQFAVVVRGTSAEKIARDGEFLLCVNHNKAGLELRSGDLVIVRRQEVATGRAEMTARRLSRTTTELSLAFDSDDMRYIGTTMKLPTTGTAADAHIRTHIAGVVLGVFRSVRPEMPIARQVREPSLLERTKARKQKMARLRT